MSTWTCRVASGVILGLVAGCGELPDLGLGSSNREAPLARASLGKGQVVLVPPDGYCIDRKSLKERFALMARCDTLGAGRAKSGAPLAVVTASLAHVDSGRLPEFSAIATPSEAVLETEDHGDLRLVSVQGTPPAEGLSSQYWRGAGMLGAYMLGLTAYGPEEAAGLGPSGATLIAETFDRTQTRSVEANIEKTVIVEGAPEASGPKAGKKSGQGLFAGLFQ